MTTPRPGTSIRLSEEARELQRALSAKLGINLTSVMELALRKLAEAEGIETQASMDALKRRYGVEPAASGRTREAYKAEIASERKARRAAARAGAK